MTTTLVRDSIVGDDWIKQCAQFNPVSRKLGADGQPTGDILTGPVRLAFTDSLTETKQGDDDGNKYSADLLFTPLADLRIFYEEYWAACAREWAHLYNQYTPNDPYPGLHSPFKDQALKAGKYGGFTPGCINITSGTHFKPPIVDSRFNPIVDMKRIYPGVWAICAVRPYAFGKAGKTKDGQPMKKGIGFGLQSIMIIGDDTRFGGGPVDAKSMFSDVKVQAPIARPDMSQMPAGGAPAPAAAIPGYTAPGGGMPMPGAPAPGFAMPQTTYTPAAPQGFTPPGVQSATPGYPPQQNYATPPAQYATTTSPSEEDELRAMGIIP